MCERHLLVSGYELYYGCFLLTPTFVFQATIIALERTLLLQLTKNNFHNFLHVVPDLKVCVMCVCDVCAVCVCVCVCVCEQNNACFYFVIMK